MSNANWRVAAAQSRSRETEARLARAATTLLSERSYAEVSVADVARSAGVSVGGYYARFRGKSALLHLADLAFLDDCLAAFETALGGEAAMRWGPSRVIRTWVGVMVAKFREHRGPLLQAIRHAGPDDGAAFAARARAFNERVHGRMRTLLRVHRQRIRHRDPDQAINLALFFAAAAARDAVWRNGLSVYPVALDDQALADEIARAAMAYLNLRASK